MKILYITQYYSPDIGAASNRASDFSKYLSELGNKVTVITSTPHYLGGRSTKYKKRITKEKQNNTDLIRCKIKPATNSLFGRLSNYFSFMFLAGLAAFKTKGNYDIIYTTSPPLFVGLTGFFISKIKRGQFVFEVRDIWPKSAVEFGYLKPGLLVTLGEMLEKFIYKRAKKIIVVTCGIKSHIKQIVPEEKISIVKNGVNLSLIKKSNSERLVKTLGLENKFIVIYAGLHGLAQGLEQVVDVADKLKDHKDIMFVLIGDGPKKSEVIDYAKKKNAKNILFLGAVPRTEITKYLSFGDVSLVPLKNPKFGEGVLPSKLFENMALGLPIVSNLPGEAKKVLNDSQAGIFVEPGDSAVLAKTILNLKNNSKLCKKLGENGKTYAKNNFDRKLQATELNKILAGLVKK